MPKLNDDLANSVKVTPTTMPKFKDNLANSEKVKPTTMSKLNDDLANYDSYIMKMSGQQGQNSMMTLPIWKGQANNNVKTQW